MGRRQDKFPGLFVENPEVLYPSANATSTPRQDRYPALLVGKPSAPPPNVTASRSRTCDIFQISISTWMILSSASKLFFGFTN
jgi:hypothetical protein